MEPENTNKADKTATPVVAKKTNSLSVVGFIFSFLIPLLGLILSIVSLSQIKKNNEGGKGLAVAGIILSSIIMLISLVLIITFAVGLNSAIKGPSTSNNTLQQASNTSSEQPTTETSRSAETAQSTVTVSQKNATNKAKDYLSYTAFSYEGLISQLEYERFSHEDAVYGADNSGADWMDQAAKKAKSYMDYSSFSRGSLISQLEYDKFTPEQAAHGADSVGL